MLIVSCVWKFKFYFLKISGNFDLQFVESANAEPWKERADFYFREGDMIECVSLKKIPLLIL